MSDYVTRQEYERIITARVRAIDKALSAMLIVLERELQDDQTGLGNLRETVSSLRTRLVSRYPFAREVIGQ